MPEVPPPSEIPWNPSKLTPPGEDVNPLDGWGPPGLEVEPPPDLSAVVLDWDDGIPSLLLQSAVTYGEKYLREGTKGLRQDMKGAQRAWGSKFHSQLHQRHT